VRNFLNSIREGEKLNAPVEVGAKTAIISEMGNIAYRLGNRIHWNNSTNRFLEDDANELSNMSYNNGWELPVI
jgi:hypothetical protein